MDTAHSIFTNLLAFFRGLRRLGITVGVEEEALIFRALVLLDLEDSSVIRDALQSLLIRDPQQIPLFRHAWKQFLLWLSRRTDPFVSENTLTANLAKLRRERHRHPDILWMGHLPKSNSQPKNEQAPDWETVSLRSGASRQEVLQHKDFAKLSPLEQDEILHTISTLRPLMKKSLRRKSHAKGDNWDLSNTLRKGVTTGEFVTLAKLKYRLKQRPVLLFCDVSGSMDPYSRMLMRFAHGLLLQKFQVEVFVFSTRLTRITRALKNSNSQQALMEAASLVPDFSGGTRLAEALSQFTQEYARTFLRKGAIVLLATDGFDSGSDEQLKEQLEKLKRFSHLLIWLNPALSDPRYAPDARGAEILTDCVDDMLPAYSFGSLENLWKMLELPQGLMRRRRNPHGGTVKRTYNLLE